MFADRTGWNLECNKLSEALAKHRFAGKPLIDLTRSNPTECGFHFDAQQILSALNNPANLEYHPTPQGLPEARQAIVEYYRSYRVQTSIDNICLTASTSEAYSFIFRTLCNPGDEVLVPQPGYPLLNFLADLHDVKLGRYPLIYDHGWQIDFHSLVNALTPKTRAVVVVHPNNPTGHFCKPDDFSQLNEICAQREIAIIADEVFLDFSFGPNAPASFVVNGDALTFTMSGLSKISALPQMKLAWLIVSGPENLKQQTIARLEVIADTYLSVNTPTQLALPTFLKQRTSFRQQWWDRTQKNLVQLDSSLRSQELCTRLEVEGGWYAVLKVPMMKSDDELAMKLLNNRGIYVHPGHFYDFPTDGYLVVSLITPERELALGIDALLSELSQDYRVTKDS